MVNIPKTKKAYCKGPECRRHTMHKVTQYKKGKDSISAQGAYDQQRAAGGGGRVERGSAAAEKGGGGPRLDGAECPGRGGGGAACRERARFLSFGCASRDLRRPGRKHRPRELA